MDLSRIPSVEPAHGVSAEFEPGAPVGLEPGLEVDEPPPGLMRIQ